MVPTLLAVLLAADPAPPLALCRSSADCGLVSTRCLAADAGTPDARCVCVDGFCALKPATPPPPTGACSVHGDCGVDRSGGVCVAAPAVGHRFNAQVEGPACACVKGACAYEWLEPVPCASWRDCSFSREPVLHPVSSKKVKRLHPKPVRPCQDGESDSVCDEKAKTCRVVSWKC